MISSLFTAYFIIFLCLVKISSGNAWFLSYQDTQLAANPTGLYISSDKGKDKNWRNWLALKVFIQFKIEHVYSLNVRRSSGNVTFDSYREKRNPLLTLNDLYDTACMTHNRLSNFWGVYTIIQVVHTKFINVALTDYSAFKNPSKMIQEQAAAVVIIALISEKK